MRWLAAVAGGSALAGALAAHAAVNVRLLRVPVAQPVTEPVAVLVPARDEQEGIAAVVTDLLGQRDVAQLQLIVLDDGSTDRTGQVLAGLYDPRLQVISSPDEPPPPGWLGKPWACQRLAQAAAGRASVLVFADADVRFAPDAVAAAVTLLREHRMGLVAPAPKQVAVGWLERLVQPLLGWSWLATMPLRWSERSLRPSLVSANGQFLVVDAQAYQAAGGHGAVRGEVLEDIALGRALRVAGYPTLTCDGTRLARGRMYSDAQGVVDGYGKSLWSAFGGVAGSVGVVGLLAWIYVVPPIAAVVGPTWTVRAVGAFGYAAGVVGRVVTGRRMADRVWPDALAHPASIAVFTALNALSWHRQCKGTNSWKGRRVAPRATGS